jgi:hypothetical protein
MLRAWLEPESVDWFARTHLDVGPFARPGAARASVATFQWDTLDALLREQGEAEGLDLLCVARGALVEAPAPRSLAALRELMAVGTGIVIRRAERASPELARLAAALAEDLTGDPRAEAHIQLFVTPGGTNGFGWHYDFEQVFIVQTAGSKDYYFRRNTVDPHRPRQTRPDFSVFRQEKSPIAAARLLAGDWLYIPARWWHVAQCLEDSLSVSIGVFTK